MERNPRACNPEAYYGGPLGSESLPIDADAQRTPERALGIRVGVPVVLRRRP